MSHFGTTLKALIESNQLAASDVAKQAEIDPSLISRWMSGTRSTPSLDNLSKVAAIVGKTRRERAEIIASHLRDRCDGPGSELIRISVDGKAPKQLIPDNDIEYLVTSAAHDPVLLELLSNLAKIHRAR
jgi:transcriptional regulator with XRE-family HTH domain